MSRIRTGLALAAGLLLTAAACDDESQAGPMEPAGQDTGSLEIAVITRGESVPDGYRISIDGGRAANVGANGSVEITDLAAGEHSLLVTAIADNCTVEGENPQSVQVVVGMTVSTTFRLSCSTTLGTLAVATSATGPDPDSDGYSLSLDGGAAGPIGVHETRTLDELEEGLHTLELIGIAGNCVLIGPNPRPVEILAAETTTLNLEVECETAPNHQIVFSRHADGTPGRIFVMEATGSNPVLLRTGYGPDFSPDGSKIVFAEAHSYVFDIVVMNGDGSEAVPLITYSAWGYPAWSPDGTRIAFPGSHESYSSSIQVMDAEGRNLTNLTASSGWDLQPAWSPDGSRIAFVRLENDGREIYLMDSDGSNPRLLTDHPGSKYDPAWSPDGTRIAFASETNGNLDIHVVEVDGSNVVRLTNHPAADREPAWAPDGSRIAFATERDGNFELYWMDADGTDPRRLTYDPRHDRHPAWSP